MYVVSKTNKRLSINNIYQEGRASIPTTQPSMSRPDGRLAGGRAGLATLRQSELVESSPAVETQLISPSKTQTDGG